MSSRRSSSTSRTGLRAMTEAESELRERVEALESRVSELESLAEKGEMTEDTPEMREFVEAADASSHVERAATIGRFLEEFGGKDSFKTKDIEEGYKACRTPLPSNLSDVLRRAEKQDLTMVVDTDGQEKSWRLTADGEELVASLRSNDSE